MATAIERLQAQSDRQKVEVWLDFINERCPVTRADVLDQCANDTDARRYYVTRFEQDCAA